MNEKSRATFVKMTQLGFAGVGFVPLPVVPPRRLPKVRGNTKPGSGRKKARKAAKETVVTRLLP